MNGPVETKVAAATVTTLLAGAFFGAAAFYHWFTPPPLALQATITALLTAVAGWLAPHTSRLKPLSQAQADLLDQAAALAHPVQVPPVMNVSATPPAQPAAGGTP